MGKNWRQQKGKKPMRRETMKTIPEDEEIEEEKSGIQEWTEEDDDEIGNLADQYYKLQEKSSGRGNLRGGQCHDLAKQLSYYLYFFSFLLSWTYYTEGSVGKCHITSVTSVTVT